MIETAKWVPIELYSGPFLSEARMLATVAILPAGSHWSLFSLPLLQPLDNWTLEIAVCILQIELAEGDGQGIK